MSHRCQCCYPVIIRWSLCLTCVSVVGTWSLFTDHNVLPVAVLLVPLITMSYRCQYCRYPVIIHWSHCLTCVNVVRTTDHNVSPVCLLYSVILFINCFVDQRYILDGYRFFISTVYMFFKCLVISPLTRHFLPINCDLPSSPLICPLIQPLRMYSSSCLTFVDCRGSLSVYTFCLMNCRISLKPVCKHCFAREYCIAIDINWP